MEEAIMLKIVMFVLPIFIGVTSYFFKRTMNMIDEMNVRVGKLEIDHFRLEKVEKTQDDIVAELGKIKEGLSDVKINYISKREFFNSMTKLDGKIDRITNLIIERGAK